MEAYPRHSESLGGRRGVYLVNAGLIKAWYRMVDFTALPSRCLQCSSCSNLLCMVVAHSSAFQVQSLLSFANRVGGGRMHSGLALEAPITVCGPLTVFWPVKTFLDFERGF